MKKHQCDDLNVVCGRSCNQEEVAHLVTRLGLVEGEILEALESGDLTLRRMMESLEWEPCAVAMAAGALIRQGLIRSLERGGEVYLELAEIKQG